MSEIVEDLPTFTMARGGCPYDPPPLDRLQAEEPLARVKLWDGSTAWMVTRSDDARHVLADPRISSDSRNDGFPFSSAAQSQTWNEFSAFIDQRHLVTADFMTKRVEAMRPRIQKLTDELIDDLLAGPKPVDLVEALALPLPSLVVCELLGVPYADRAQFYRLGKTLLRRDREPADDLLSRLFVQQVQAIANMIALGTVALLEHPDQLADLRSTDDPNAIEELLRYLTIVHDGRRRVALADLKIGGQLIRRGEGVIIATELANRDAHQCLGQPLARVELQVVFSTLYRRIPTLALTVPVGELPFKHDLAIYGVHALPVTWESRP